MKILVANRSEIACRIFQTCKELGFQTVGIFAPGDEEARHLTYADQIVPVSNYLEIKSVVEAARNSGTNLIHPGYGFLSERPSFAQAVEEAGIVFIGPTAQTMEKMGGKIAAKETAHKALVPTLPWARVPVGGDIKGEAKRVGFPLLLKASAGGGGKGMRRVDRMEDLASSAESASAEALSSFGDGTLMIEKLIIGARHIEVQVLGDGRGGGIHLHERECSLQRRHQKVWEEARAPHLSAKTRDEMFASALRLLQVVKYRSAGTLEFLVDQEENFYFLEMNTRLQVEHPVTELVTGLDLVRLQLELAINPDFKLPETPDVRGHAIEVRLYAEDPAKDFMPTPGRIERLSFPKGPGIRIDSGIEEGQTIGTGFDSMLAKLIVHAPDRAHAVSRMREALSETVILGIGSNQSYLYALSKHPAVIEGKVDTDFLAREFGDFAPEMSQEEASVLAQSFQIQKRETQVESVISPWSFFKESL